MMADLQKIFDAKFKSFFQKLVCIESDFKEVFVKYPAHIEMYYKVQYAEALLRHYQGKKVTRELFDAYRLYSQHEENADEFLSKSFEEIMEEKFVRTGLLQEITDITNAVNRLRTGLTALAKECPAEIRSAMERCSFSELCSSLGNSFRNKTNNMYDFRKNQGKEVMDEALWAQTLFLFGHMIKEFGFCPVEYNATGELKFEDLWNLINGKDKQVNNSTSFSSREIAKLISGANMSGKTYFLKALIFGILCGLATGYAPAKKAAMPLFEALVYLDRVTAKNDRNLSAYANELTFWIKIFKLILEGKSILSAVDEAFSTTSPRYQSALTYAVVMSMLALGKYLAIASHNHDALDALEKINPQHIKAYHFDTHFDEKGEIQFDYKMAPGHELSQAIAVAKKLGLPQEIIDIALSL